MGILGKVKSCIMYILHVLFWSYYLNDQEKNVRLTNILNGTCFL